MDVIIIEHKIICKYFPLYIFIYLLCNDGTSYPVIQKQ